MLSDVYFHSSCRLSGVRNEEIPYTTLFSVIPDLTCHLLKRHALHFCLASNVVIATWQKIIHESHATFNSVTLPYTRINLYHTKLPSRQSLFGRINPQFCFLAKQVYSIRFPNLKQRTFWSQDIRCPQINACNVRIFTSWIRVGFAFL